MIEEIAANRTELLEIGAMIVVALMLLGLLALAVMAEFDPLERSDD